jgi:hypothetical protein
VGLVAADVEELAWCERRDLGEYVANEPVREVGVRVERGEADVDARVRLRPPPARQLRIRTQRRMGVARRIDLRHDGDESLGRVADDPAVVVLRVEAAGVAADRAAAAVLGQPRPTVDRQSPALVVGEVQMQHVELVRGEMVDHPADVVDAEEVTGDVEHRATPCEARAVGDRDVRRRPTRGERAQRLLGVEASGVGLGVDLRLAVADLEPVALRPELLVRPERRRSRDDHAPRSMSGAGAAAVTALITPGRARRPGRR